MWISIMAEEGSVRWVFGGELGGRGVWGIRLSATQTPGEGMSEEVRCVPEAKPHLDGQSALWLLRHKRKDGIRHVFPPGILVLRGPGP